MYTHERDQAVGKTCGAITSNEDGGKARKKFPVKIRSYADSNNIPETRYPFAIHDLAFSIAGNWRRTKEHAVRSREVAECSLQFLKNRSVVGKREREGKREGGETRYDAMRWRRDWMYLRRSRAHSSRETKWNYRCDCHWNISPFEGATDKGSINDSLLLAPHPLPPGRPPLIPPQLFLFFRKITHSGHLFVCSVRLLGPCSEIDRRLRPTDVCSAATALTLRHRKNIIGFSFFVVFFFVVLLPSCSSSSPFSWCITFLFGFFHILSAWEQARVRAIW